ncbi:ureidoglycolate lyase [Acidisphaera sp. L21]|uniref:ureidoglycolate lyase n=1 Tax=Acidisphaera sp. L21 TaxID=1641851 RepID=UPI00131E71D1|nr:ureidoglycolate lyase [Acidisphaera sp. L21]
MRSLKLEPLTAEAFAPYGDVIDPPAPGERDLLSDTLSAVDGADSPRLSFGHPKPWTLPLTATEMERHNRSSQCFVPLDVSRFVVMVAPDKDGKPDATQLRAFVARGDQAVNYHAGTWHHPSRALDRPARFATLMWTTGEKALDEEWSTLPEPVLLVE